MSNQARADRDPNGDPLAVPVEEATIEHVTTPPDDTSIHDAPLSDPDPVVAGPAPGGGPAGATPAWDAAESPSSTQAGALGGLIPEDRPELLVGASLAGGVLAAILLRTLVRR